MDRNELKIQALLEKISNMTAQYENQIADLRVDLTIISQDRDQLRAQLDSLDVKDQPDEEVVPEITNLPADDSD